MSRKASIPRVRKQSKQLSPSIPVKKSGSTPVMMLALSLLVIGALSAAAYARNGIYRSHVTLWANVTKQSPNKRRAHENYGQALSTAGSIATNQNEARKL